MSTAEIGVSLGEMIRKDKIHAVSCTAANLEEDLSNLFAHNEYRVTKTGEHWSVKTKSIFLKVVTTVLPTPVFPNRS